MLFFSESKLSRWSDFTVDHGLRTDSYIPELPAWQSRVCIVVENRQVISIGKPTVVATFASCCMHFIFQV